MLLYYSTLVITESALTRSQQVLYNYYTNYYLYRERKPDNGRTKNNRSAAERVEKIQRHQDRWLFLAVKQGNGCGHHRTPGTDGQQTRLYKKPNQIRHEKR